MNGATEDNVFSLSNTTNESNEEGPSKINVHITFTETQHLVVLIPLSISCALSILGSLCIIHMAKTKTLKGKPYHWIMIFVSISDILNSLCIVFHPYLVPSDEVAFAVGNTTTCTIAGALNTWSNAMSAFESSILSVYFVLTVRYGWTLKNILDYYLQPSQLVALFFVTVPVVITVFAQAFNPYGTIISCAVVSYPRDCARDDNVECIRGEHADSLFFMFIVMVIVVSMISFVSTALVYWTVQQRIQESKKFQLSIARNNVIDTNNGEDDNNNDANDTSNDELRQQQLQKQQQNAIKSKAQQNRMHNVRMQAVLYSLIYLNQLFWPFTSFFIRNTISSNISNSQVARNTLFVFVILSHTMLPLQGFFNFFVYVRPTVQEWRQYYSSLIKNDKNIVMTSLNDNDNGQVSTPQKIMPSWFTIVTKHVLPCDDIQIYKRRVNFLNSNRTMRHSGTNSNYNTPQSENASSVTSEALT